jgi:hypothetical protein
MLRQLTVLPGARALGTIAARQDGPFLLTEPIGSVCI